MQILPPASCTASVTCRWRGTSRGLDSLPAKGFAQPARFGAMPPLTSRPAPPRARSAKYSASLPKSAARSSRPVCIEPMTMRFASRVNPRSSGSNSRGYDIDRMLARYLGHQTLRECVVRRDQQRALERFARTDHVALVVQRPAEKGIGFGTAPFGCRRGTGARRFEHRRHGAQLLDRRGFFRHVLAGAIVGDEGFHQPHARILGLELHGFLDARADVAA